MDLWYNREHVPQDIGNAYLPLSKVCIWRNK